MLEEASIGREEAYFQAGGKGRRSEEGKETSELKGRERRGWSHGLPRGPGLLLPAGGSVRGSSSNRVKTRDATDFMLLDLSGQVAP